MATKFALTAVENKIPNITSLVKKTDFDSKITEVEGKNPNISSLATNSALTTVENKIPGVTNLVTKTDFDAKLKDISDRVTKNKSKVLLLDNELKKLKTFNTNYFIGKNYFEEDDGAQNTLVFQVKSTFFKQKSLGNTKYNTWKSKGISDQILYFANDDITTKLTRPSHAVFGANDYFFQGSAKVITNKNIINVYITCKLIPKTINTDNALTNCLFDSIEASRPGNTTDPDNFIYSGWGIGFDHTGTFTHPEGGTARNVIIFGVDMSGSNKTKDFLVLRKCLIQMIEICITITIILFCL